MRYISLLLRYTVQCTSYPPTNIVNHIIVDSKLLTQPDGAVAHQFMQGYLHIVVDRLLFMLYGFLGV